MYKILFLIAFPFVLSAQITPIKYWEQNPIISKITLNYSEKPIPNFTANTINIDSIKYVEFYENFKQEKVFIDRNYIILTTPTTNDTIPVPSKVFEIITKGLLNTTTKK